MERFASARSSSGFEGWLTNPVAGSEGSGPGSRQPSPSRTAMAAGGPFAAVTGFAPPGAAGSGGGTLNPLYDRAQSGSFAGAATPAGVSDLLARLVELQRQQSEFAQAQAEIARQQAELAQRAEEVRRSEADQCAKLERRRRRQEARQAWVRGTARTLAFVCALLGGVMLIPLLGPAQATFVNAQQWRGNGARPREKTACWGEPSLGRGNLPICRAWQKVYGTSASLSFMLEIGALLLCVGVAMGWSRRLQPALLLLLLGAWGAALAVVALFWLYSTKWLAVFVSAAMACFGTATALFLPSVVALPLVWAYSFAPWARLRGASSCCGGKAGGKGSKASGGKGGPPASKLQLEGLDCRHTGAVHWASWRYTDATKGAAGKGGWWAWVRRGALGACLRLLARTEEDLDRPDQVSPLFVAALRGNAAAVRILLAAGADPDHAFTSLEEGPYEGLNFPLKAAAAGGHREATWELLRSGADPNQQDQAGRTALHAAAAAGHAPVVEALLGFGASAAKQDCEGWSALHAAAAGGHAAAADMLLRAGLGVGLPDDRGRTPAHAAAASGSVQVLERLLSRGASPNALDAEGRTPLHAAAAAGSSEAVEALLAAGADPFMADHEGVTPLSAAVMGGSPQAVAALLGCGADANAASPSGHTPLYTAVVAGDAGMVQVLLAAGADVNTADGHGYTPLHAAVVGGHPQVVELLLAAGADPGIQDLDGNSPLHVAAAAGGLEVVRAFRASGRVPEPSRRNASGAAPRQVAELSGWRSVAAELEDWELHGGPVSTLSWRKSASASGDLALAAAEIEAELEAGGAKLGLQEEEGWPAGASGVGLVLPAPSAGPATPAPPATAVGASPGGTESTAEASPPVLPRPAAGGGDRGGQGQGAEQGLGMAATEAALGAALAGRDAGSGASGDGASERGDVALDVADEAPEGGSGRTPAARRQVSFSAAASPEGPDKV